MQLSEIKKEKDEIKRARLLKQYCRSSKMDPENLKRYLEREMKITQSNQWRLSCKKWLTWLIHQQEIKVLLQVSEVFLESFVLRNTGLQSDQ